MNVHIVLWQDNHIIPRMAQWLVDRNGWTISEEPDHTADINYYLPYLMNDIFFNSTKKAAWFTHYQDDSEWKIKRWKKAAVSVDLPLVTAPMYCNPDYYLSNPTVITPGVDRDNFTPGHQPNNAKPVIGTAGVGQPRKGPKLLVDLFYSGLSVDLRITGTAWPFPHMLVPSDQMPAWYSYLDVYLCTSLIEGIPAPVLEALACDVKVVIPNGVGICDQLPEMEGIRHYDKGDGKDMIRAIQQVLDDKPSAGALRDVTADYSIDEWCNSHMVAMEKLLDAPVPV